MFKEVLRRALVPGGSGHLLTLPVRSTPAQTQSSHPFALGSPCCCPHPAMLGQPDNANPTVARL